MPSKKRDVESTEHPAFKFKKDEKRTEIDEKIVSTIVIAQVELSGV